MATTFGNGKICYVELPARDLQASAAFYETVFGWTIRTDAEGTLAFDDGVGGVSGTWILDTEPAATGLVIHIMVDDINTSVALLTAHGGQISEAIQWHGHEATAKFRDPAGNILGLYQQ
jgi:predicted enzyme related to lactoylglutathione lyase